MGNKEDILRHWINKGYEICLPGGSGRDGSNAALVCLGYYLPDKSCEIYVLPVFRESFDFEEYRKKQKNNFKLQYENIFKVGRREVNEEMNTPIDLAHTFLVTEKRVPDDRPGFEKRIHIKGLLLAERYDARYMRKRISKKEPNLGIPIAVPFELFEKYLTDSQRWVIEPLRIYLNHRVNHLPSLEQILAQKKRTRRKGWNKKKFRSAAICI